MKMYRYTGRPTTLRGSYQLRVVTLLNEPFGYDEFDDHYCNNESSMDKWYFGFTKEQLRFANLLAKEEFSKTGFNYKWNKSSHLVSFEVPDDKILILNDQVAFHKDYISIPFEQFK